MCFVLLALGQHPEYPFILAANRDEFYARPALPLQAWEEAPAIVAGKDVESGGSWLALNQQDARLVLVTNVREGKPQAGERSRGLLVRDLVSTADFPAELAQLPAQTSRYAGYNLIAGHLSERLYYYSNRPHDHAPAKPVLLEHGFHALSNARLDTPWPKVERGKAAFMQLVRSNQINTDALFAMLADRQIAKDADLPDTGIGLERERWLSSIFIQQAEFAYGTRCSTLILMDRAGKVSCHERTYLPGKAGIDHYAEFYSG